MFFSVMIYSVAEKEVEEDDIHYLSMFRQKHKFYNMYINFLQRCIYMYHWTLAYTYIDLN